MINVIAIENSIELTHNYLIGQQFLNTSSCSVVGVKVFFSFKT